MRRPILVYSFHLIFGAWVCLTTSGCGLLELLSLGDSATGNEAGVGVRVLIENQSGLLARVEGTYFATNEDARLTSRLLQPAGPESLSFVVWTRADRIVFVANVDNDAVFPVEFPVKAGDQLAEVEFLLGQDFFGDETLVFIIPPIPLTPEFGPDCNENNILDVLDIQNGVSEDCNENTIPDECEIDVGSTAPGGPFFCVEDCDPDCNNNGIPDSCDLCPSDFEPTPIPVAAPRRLGGPMIIGGDDLTDHGSRDEGGNPREGWLYIQAAVQNILPLVNRPGHDGTIAALGSGRSTATCCNAGAAIGTAAAAAEIAVNFYEGEAAINQFFDELAAGTVNPAILWTAGTGAINDLNPAEGVALGNNAQAIAAFVNSGGGLLAHGSGEPAFGWLNTLLPDLNHIDSGGNTDLAMTPAGIAAFPGLTNQELNAGPWHNHFEGDFGTLNILATSENFTDSLGNPAAVIIGGSFVTLPSMITLTPATAINLVNTQHTVTALVVDEENAPTANLPVEFEVLADGPNAGVTGSAVTNETGVAMFTYTGNGGTGTDRIQATFTFEDEVVISNIVEKLWVENCSLDCNANGVPDECEADGDEDGRIDVCDECPEDPNKTAPGQCGCGVPDVDSDGDETLDCFDDCPEDPNKIAPGQCGCGVPEDVGDDDEDGVLNCFDICPFGDDNVDCNENGIPDACDAGTRIYWTEDNENIIDVDLRGITGPSFSSVRSALADGACDLRTHRPFESFPTEIDVDSSNGQERMYWLTNSSMESSDLNGFQGETTVTLSQSFFGGIAVDQATGFVYWTEFDFQEGETVWLYRLDLRDDQAVPETLWDDFAGFPSGVAVDTTLNVLFWSAGDQLLKANPNVANPIASTVRTSSDGSSILGVAIDPMAQHVYWVEAGKTDSKIYRADFNGNIDGSAPLISFPEAFVEHLVLDLDTVPKKLYWTVPFLGKIMRADLNGTIVPEDFLTGLQNVLGIAIKPDNIPLP
ncbi:MAG: hypothetical protein MI923_12980 [Phycisphaerales bacterium]|nr:hypothetical protein [Phycisphaerales bacterium]